MPEVLGTVQTLFRFPVKSMRGERLGIAHVGPAGVDGDREWALLDGEDHWVSAKTDRARWRLYDGMLDLTARTVDVRAGAPADGADGRGWPAAGRSDVADDPVAGSVVVTLPDGRRAVPGEAAADALLSDHLGAPIRFDRGDGGRRWGRHHDASPLHLVTTASLAALHADGPADAGEDVALDPRRLRPNLVVRTPDGVSGFAETAWLGATLRVGGALLRVTEPTERCVMTTRAQGDEVPLDATVLRRIGRRNRAVAGIYLDVLEAGTIAAGDDVVLVSRGARGAAA